MIKNLIAVLLLVTSFNSQVFSNDVSIPDISNMSVEEIEKLPEEIINQLDSKEIYLKIGLPENIYNTLLNFAFYRLFYFFENQNEDILNEKIIMFQKHLNEEQTGNLTFKQMNDLIKFATNFNQTEVTPLSGFGDKLSLTNFGNYFSTTGTFYLEGEQIAYPVNKSEVICRKSLNQCETLMAFVMLPYEDDSSDTYYLDFQRSTYNILKWSDSEILAEDEGDCRTNQLVINFNSDEVYEITRNNRTKACDETLLNQLLKSQGGEGMPDLDKPRIARLVPGSKLLQEFWKERKKTSSEKFLPKEIREKFESLGNL